MGLRLSFSTIKLQSVSLITRTRTHMHTHAQTHTHTHTHTHSHPHTHTHIWVWVCVVFVCIFYQRLVLNLKCNQHQADLNSWEPFDSRWIVLPVWWGKELQTKCQSEVTLYFSIVAEVQLCSAALIVYLIQNRWHNCPLSSQYSNQCNKCVLFLSTVVTLWVIKQFKIAGLWYIYIYIRTHYPTGHNCDWP